ncbi:preprotein translocase subunit SecG [Aedoeadaptatus ivorii]|uniref:Protein-export membrane protein SecG n=1 Tax=Aedoeadaptatus ivorii TaxID=54006 RepID=A0A448V0L4_9FIRM|nr:preprotein translocase subunit SecG [Peptoniphilus ivorii]MDQ0508055.1 preprotein translocase subunit SecG [Peptoniphilus ivorii]VEJ34969.1 preprotein translocase subunit SecG [Peptoniphilus ivorii]
MTTFLSIIVALSAIALILSVVVQESTQVGLGTLDGSGGASAEWGANRGTSRKEMLKRITVVTSVVFFISIIVLIAVTQ